MVHARGSFLSVSMKWLMTGSWAYQVSQGGGFHHCKPKLMRDCQTGIRLVNVGQATDTFLIVPEV